MRPINKPLRNAEGARYLVYPLIRATAAKKNMLEIGWPKTTDYLVRCTNSPRNPLVVGQFDVLSSGGIPVKAPGTSKFRPTIPFFVGPNLLVLDVFSGIRPVTN